MDVTPMFPGDDYAGGVVPSCCRTGGVACGSTMVASLSAASHTSAVGITSHITLARGTR
jgi:hypothetical protein